MADEDEDLGDFVRYGSILLPLADAAPSTAVHMAYFNPGSGNITVIMKDGTELEFPGGIAEWLSYKTSFSKGQWVNARIKHKGLATPGGQPVLKTPAGGPASAPPLRSRSTIGRK